MPRSQSENENVQFVQELAEVDGPFESPININFRDLTKLELPALVWNRGDTRPKKMKITNTGHTVIISGKWKSERPYLTGGPLTGKYVFSQIHFHWGQDNLRGSEHQVCGEGYPLEMHVAHFKTEYLTQECALREKDGMVVVVYLFKLQEEPNNSLKKIINLLPCVKQASTSHAIDPRPILSLCNPFTEDYFMYWGSVVTSTCAHILLWIICREPFGISKEQVNEFRKIMDLSQEPICRNSRDIQPLHKRNVFHVNASKHLDEPLLPVKKILGCYCKGSEDNVSVELTSNCTCQFSSQNQEEVEGRNAEYPVRNHCISSEGMRASNEKASLPSSCFPNQTIFVQTATVRSVSILLKRFGSDPVDHSCPGGLQEIQSQDNSRKLTSQSCCFFSTSDTQEIHTDKRKIRDRKRPFNSLRAFSQIMSSLEALKSHTFKKLREIESINQEIKGIKPLFHDAEDKQWLRKIEKMMARKKGFTIKTSQGCLRELRKLAKECNFDKFFDSKTLPDLDNDEKVLWMNRDEMERRKIPNSYMKRGEVATKRSSSDKITFPETAQKLIQSFFEDIKDSDEIQDNTKKNPETEGFCCKPALDVNSGSSVSKGYITQNMFKLGNLGDRFFTEVTAEDADVSTEQNEYKKPSEKLLVLKELNEEKNESWSRESQEIITNEEHTPEEVVKEKKKKDPVIPLHRANVSIAISKGSLDQTDTLEDLYEKQDSHLTDEERFPSFDSISTRRLLYRHGRRHRPSSQKAFEQIFSRRLKNLKNRELLSLANKRLMRALERKAALEDIQLSSSSNPSTESLETPSMIIAKFHRKMARKSYWPVRRSSIKISPKRHGKISCKKFEGYYIEENNHKERKSKRRKRRTWCTISRSKDWKALILNPKLKRAKFKLQIGSTTSNSTTPSDLEKPISPKRKKLRLENMKFRLNSSGETKLFSDDELTVEEISAKNRSAGHQTNKMSLRKGNLEKREDEEPNQTSKGKHSIRSYRPSEAVFEISCKTPRSAVSSRNFTEGQRLKESKVFERSADGETSEPEPRGWQKLKTKNKSLGSMIITPKVSTRFTQELPVEHLDDRRKTKKEVLEPRTPKHSKESSTGENLCNEILNETHRNGERKEAMHSPELEDGPNAASSNKVQCNVGFLTTSSLVDDELLPNDLNQEGITKNVLLKRCDAEKYMFLEKSPQNVSLPLKNPNGLIGEILHQTDSNISFNVSKGDAEPANFGNKDLQTSISYTTLKKNSASRPHSAETLNFLMKSIKRKYKKRPHCRKRNSIHYIRKNSSKKFEEVLFRKPSKEKEKAMPVKETQSLRLRDGEQANVSLSEKTEKEVKTKRYEKKRKVPTSKLLYDPKKEKIPKPGAADRKTAPSTPKSTPNQAPSTAPPKPTGANERPATALQKPGLSGKKPVNNFIKLNKQLAGKYKRAAVSPEKKPVRAKAQQSQTKVKLATAQQPAAKAPRKRGKIPIPKPDFHTRSAPRRATPNQTGEKPSPTAEEGEMAPENRIRSLGCLKLDRAFAAEGLDWLPSRSSCLVFSGLLQECSTPGSGYWQDKHEQKIGIQLGRWAKVRARLRWSPPEAWQELKGEQRNSVDITVGMEMKQKHRNPRENGSRWEKLERMLWEDSDANKYKQDSSYDMEEFAQMKQYEDRRRRQ